MIKAFEQSDFLDCKVNAYRSYTEYKGINRQAPNFIFIHLDRSTSNTERAHRMTLSNTLRDIKDRLAGGVILLYYGLKMDIMYISPLMRLYQKRKKYLAATLINLLKHS